MASLWLEQKWTSIYGLWSHTHQTKGNLSHKIGYLPPPESWPFFQVHPEVEVVAIDEGVSEDFYIENGGEQDERKQRRIDPRKKWGEGGKKELMKRFNRWVWEI